MPLPAAVTFGHRAATIAVMRFVASVLLLVLFASACSTTAELGAVTDPSQSDVPVEAAAIPEATATPSPTEAPSPTPGPSPAPSPTPEPTQTPEPTSTPAPTPTPDPSPVVFEGDDWELTENEIADLAAYVETVQELEFTEPVGVLSDLSLIHI